MTLRMAWRSLVAQPVRSAVLACGFGLGITAMAGLLGVGEVVLEQSRAPGLQGGGDLRIAGWGGGVPAPQFVLQQVLGEPPLAEKIASSAPSREAELYLIDPSGATTAIAARGGIPSLERAMGDDETATIAAWQDLEIDRPWIERDPGRVLRQLDRFHRIPEAAGFEDSWAEWLYFNGGTGSAKFYLTFLVGPRTAGAPANAPRRHAGVRLQLEQSGRMTSWFAGDEIEEEALLAAAPDLTIGENHVRLVGTRYEIDLRLTAEDGRRELTGTLSLAAPPGRAMPPIEIAGARGWVTGYVVPVLSGELGGRLRVDDRVLSFDGGEGYHDHNWGFWKGVTWQWGQAAGDGLSFVWGHVRPPAEAADPEQFPAFFAVIGPDGPVGHTIGVRIEETEDEIERRPGRIQLWANGDAFELRVAIEVESAVQNPPVGPIGDRGSGAGLVQMRGACHITGKLAERKVDFRAPCSAETFR